jgi:hypothetical protein
MINIISPHRLALEKLRVKQIEIYYFSLENMPLQWF